MTKYIAIGTEFLSVDSWAGIKEAENCLYDAGYDAAEVWVTDLDLSTLRQPDLSADPEDAGEDPGGYPNGSRIWAQKRSVESC